MIFFIILIIIVIIAIAIINRKEKKQVNTASEINNSLPYSLRNDFLSKAEFSFYKVLSNVLKEDYLICPKVGLNDIFFVSNAKNRSESMTYLNKINRKHVDFLLVNKTNMIPVLGIELDDKSHNRQDRIERDSFVEAVFEKTNLPLVRFDVKYSYVPNELSDKIGAVLTSILKESEKIEKQNQEEIIVDNKCDRCGGDFILREAKKGPNKGKKFLGCSNYPKCKHMINLD